MLFKIPNELAEDAPARDPKPDYCQTKELDGAYQGATLHHHEFEKSEDDIMTNISSDHYGTDNDHIHLKEVGTEKNHKFVPKSHQIPNLASSDTTKENQAPVTADGIAQAKEENRENIQFQVDSADMSPSGKAGHVDVAENNVPVAEITSNARPLDLHDQITDPSDAEVKEKDNSTEEVQININDQVCIEIKEKTEDTNPTQCEVPTVIVAPVQIQTRGDAIAGCPKYPGVTVPEIHTIPTGAGDDNETNNEVVGVGNDDGDIDNGVIAMHDQEVVPVNSSNNDQETSPYDIEKTVGGVKIAERVRVIEDVTLVDLVPNPNGQNQNQ